MGQSTPVVLAATGVSFANEWINTGDPNFRIGAAGLLFALLLDGLEKITPTGAKGLGYIMFITVLFTPVGGKSPAQTLEALAVASPKGK